MPHPTAVLFALLASATAATAPSPAGRQQSNGLAQVQFRGQITIRVPSMPMPAPMVGTAGGKPPRYDEKKGPKCVPIGQLAGAFINDGDLDLMLKNGERMRAKLEGNCDSVGFSGGFYRGFYLRANADGQVCAGRDAIRTRSGDSCGIKRFHKLVLKR